MKRAIFPGSFDPITLGHYDIIKRGVTLFDEVIVAIGINADKKYMFTVDERKKFIEDTFADEPKIKVTTYEGLTVDFCKKIDVEFILRGSNIILRVYSLNGIPVALSNIMATNAAFKLAY